MQSIQAARGIARASAAVGMAVCVLLAGCGGGGGGGGGGSAGGGVPDGGGPALLTLSPDIYPLNSGDRRTWHTASDPAGTVRHERVGEAVAAAGGAFVVRSGAGDPSDVQTDDYLMRTATSVVSVPGPDSDALTKAAGPIDVVRFGIAQGQTVVLFDRTLSVDVNGDGRLDSVDLHIDSLFVGIEPITTELGAFTGASHVRTGFVSTVRLAGYPTSGTVSVTLDEWYMPGIGSVRSSSSTKFDGGAATVQINDLVAYGVGSRHSDTTAPTVLKSLPASGASSQGVLEAQVQFSEPIDPLSLQGSAGLVVLRDGSPMAMKPLHLSDGGKTLLMSSTSTLLPDGQYELRNGGQVTDWAGNPAQTLLSSFRIDTARPHLLSTSPADGAQEAPITGTLTFTFDEPVIVPPGVALQVSIKAPMSDTGQMLPATLQGNSVVAVIAAPLIRNKEYVAAVVTELSDAAGNPMSSTGIVFRTDPGPLGRPQAWATDVSVESVVAADIDGDGRTDLVFAGPVPGGDNMVGARFQQADGSYGNIRRLYTGAGCGFDGLTVADVDGDERPDIIMRVGCSPLAPVAVLRQAADGSFTRESPAVDLFGARAASELNAGQPGVVGLVDLQSIQQLRRLADGSWQSTTLVPSTGRYIAQWQAVDLNADSRMDLVWIQTAADNISYELAWALRTDSAFGPVQTLPLPSATPKGLAAGKLDASGRGSVLISVEVPTSPFGTHSELWVLAGTVAGGFAPPQRLDADFNATALLLGDLNGDGRADVILAHDTTRSTGVYLQRSDGSFEPERLFESGYGYFGNQVRPLALLDLNNDGRLDLVQAGQFLPGRAFQGAWPLDAPAGARAAGSRSTSRALRAVVKALSPASRQ
ncbi:FG-GAP-like repeat-containing protein [Roseateles sp.]|uniref:FG-GAP-like repeat-containing protein n=1 Tax=Roseateles sp. TaxID=1971397 RepID=UPI003265AB19